MRLGPYGGAFFNFNALKKLGLPREDFFVYADDHEYTSRLNDIDIDQFLVYSSRLLDIDSSFDGEGLISPNVSDLKVYYAFRNHTYLSKKVLKNKYAYIVNKSILLCLLFCRLMFKYFKNKPFVISRFKLILLAVADGENGILGRAKFLE